MDTIRIDSSDVERYLDDLGKDDQLPYAISTGLNKLANMAQSAERDTISNNFALRRRAWVLNRVYIDKTDRSSKESMQVIIQARDILPKFETGGQKIPYNRTYLAVPNPKAFGSKIIGQADPLNLHNLHLTSIKGEVRGANNTFLISSKKTGVPLILQDLWTGGKKQRKKGLNRGTYNRVLYTLVKRVSVPAKLSFVDTVTRCVQDSYQTTLEEALKKALATAK